MSSPSLSLASCRYAIPIEFDVRFQQGNIDKLGHGVYEPLDVNLLPPPHLIYAENPSDSGKTLVWCQLPYIALSKSFSAQKPTVINVIVDPLLLLIPMLIQRMGGYNTRTNF
ncbi:hypothetical protein Ahy_A01g002666 [Arachis hypogaea]|uniref:Uncharacterized protein n=1 Tax=Arachis hypogaea TaxID=3818 RepID=A0A445ERE3_ARAHY|nr:hypothetical protein Ahy_A01g002666 [Arachis hypogaea]